MADQEITLKPGQKIKPSISHENAQKLVQKLFNLESTSIKELNSYDDRNFHIKVKDSSNLPDQNDACPHGYILKILNSLDSKATNLIDAMNQMMLFLNENGISCPKPVKNIYGTLMSLEELKVQVDETWLENNDGEPTEKYIVRLLTFIPGEIFFNIPYTKELFFQVGETAAKIDLALMGFKHEGLVGVERAWNLNFVPKLTDFTFAVQDDGRRALVTEVIEGFKSTVVPCYGNLQSGPIHGDLNEQNILVDSVDGDKYTISGILDFGDIHCNYYVFELAIATCYMMIECKSMDILDVPGHVLAGYQRLRPIPELEFELLKDCISGRFCQSLVLGAYSYMQGPDPYLLTTAKRGWHCLETLWKCPKDELIKRWRGIMSQYENSL